MPLREPRRYSELIKIWRSLFWRKKAPAGAAKGAPSLCCTDLRVCLSSTYKMSYFEQIITYLYELYKIHPSKNQQFPMKFDLRWEIDPLKYPLWRKRHSIRIFLEGSAPSKHPPKNQKLRKSLYNIFQNFKYSNIFIIFQINMKFAYFIYF